MVVEKSDEAVTQILTAKRQVMRKSPVYLNTGDFHSRIKQMKNKSLFYSISIVSIVLLFLMQGYLTYSLAICFYEKDSSKILMRVSLIVLNSTFIVNVYSYFMSKLNNFVVE